MKRRFVFAFAIPLALMLAPVGAAWSQSAGSRDPAASADGSTSAGTPAAVSDPDATRPAAELLAGPIDPERYRLGPGDVLSLELSGRAARQTNIAVDAEGRVNVPEMGVVSVAGRTLAAVRTQMLGRLSRAYPGARVDLRLIVVRSFKVYVSGQVRVPGVAPANGMTRASEMFRGGFALREDASRRNIELRRRDGTRVRVDLDAFAFLGRGDDDPYLDDGDVLLVPPRRERMFAFGAFARPGEYEYAPGDSVADLVDLAGGLLPGAEVDAGVLYRFVTPTRFDSSIVDLRPAADAGGGPALQDQDRLFARRSSDYRRTLNVSVLGEVRFPGPYPIHAGQDRLAAVLALAGGVTPDAARRRLQIFRPGATSAGQRDIEFERLSRLTRSEMSDGEYTVFQTKLAAQQAAFILSMDDLAGGNPAFDVNLEDGDVIVVGRETQAVRVAGEVKRPALVEFSPGHRGDYYVGLAGGYTRRARRSDVRIARPGSNQTLLLDDVREIQPGDFIWVPEKKQVNFWGVFKDVLVAAGSVATIIIVVRGNTN